MHRQVQFKQSLSISREAGVCQNRLLTVFLFVFGIVHVSTPLAADPRRESYFLVTKPNIAVQSRPELDPSVGGPFLVSVTFRIAKVPPVGERQNILEKYVSERRPYPGWGLALRRLDTSLRPEVYWRSDDGKGGWYVFDKVELTSTQWYTLSLYVQSESFMNLFFEEFFESPSTTGTSGSIRFLGGYDLVGVKSPQSAAELQIGAAKRPFEGEFALVLVAKPEKFPKTVEELEAKLGGGGPKIVSRLKDTDPMFLGLASDIVPLLHTYHTPGWQPESETVGAKLDTPAKLTAEGSRAQLGRGKIKVKKE